LIWVGALLALRSPRLRAYRRHLFGSLRVACYVAVTSGLLFGFLAQRADAKLREQSLSLSRELMPLADLLKDATALRLNGEVVNFSMTVVEGTSVKQVLDRVQAQCEAHPGALARRSLSLLETLPKALPGADKIGQLLSKLAVTREESGTQGAVLCFSGDDGPPPASFAEEFAKTHDLGLLGRLRYVMAGQGRAAQGEQHLTRVISLWTEGHFRLERLAPPATGDAPGTDSVLIPRPPGSTRVFSAETVGAPYAVRVYETDAAASTVLAFYDTHLSGFSRLTLAGYEQTGRAYVKDAQPLLLHLTASGTKTLVTLSEVGASAQPEKVLRVER
jgi:hypothetical protein